MKKIIFGLVLIFSLLSCAKKDVVDVSINGVVKNSITQKPITGKELTIKVECWKWSNTSDESYGDFEKLNIKTNQKGEFKVNFNKGDLIIYKINEKGYKKFVKKMYLKKSDNFYEINLIPKN